MIQPGRKYSPSSSSGSYRYGFNGKENDNEVKGEGNQQDYGMRIYDPRLGKFLSVDPLTRSYPNISPYPYAMNRPIDGIDLDGLEWIHYKIQFKMTSTGERVLLSKTVVEDFRKKSESDLNEIHKTKSFYTEYSQGFGSKGRGVLYTYEELDDKGKTKSSKPVMELESGITRHGFYAGEGSITRYGELMTPGGYGNYDFGMMPIDMADTLAKEHDHLQNKPNYKGYMHTDYLNSDVLLLIKLKKFEKEFENNQNYIDPFTGRRVSKEAKDFTQNAISAFEIIVALKVAVLNEKLKEKEITQKEYDASMFLFHNTDVVEKGPMPKPSDFLNKGSK